MEAENWRLSAKLCDSCKTTSASVFCRADSAFLCLSCDSKIHAANKLASRHGRVWVCEVCEQAPATVTCKADAAALCVTCDRDIHSANPLARRHERIPVVPFYDSALAKSNGAADDNDNDNDDDDDKYFNGEDAVEAAEELEAEAASWILPTPGNNNNNNNNTIEMNDDVAPARYKSENYLFNDMDSYLDFDIMSYDQKPNIMQLEQQNYNSDGVVPTVQNNKNEIICSHFQQGQVVDGFPTYEMDFSGSKPYLYNFSSQSISQSVSSSSLDVGIVPDHSAIADVSNTFETNPSADAVPTPLSGVDREARVMRYREKRKNRKFEKTIRYASRKAYAETRPRVKGRFAKRTELDIDSLLNVDPSYGVVPSF